jgi:hypothetical protein
MTVATEAEDHVGNVASLYLFMRSQLSNAQAERYRRWLTDQKGTASYGLDSALLAVGERLLEFKEPE